MMRILINQQTKSLLFTNNINTWQNVVFISCVQTPSPAQARSLFCHSPTLSMMRWSSLSRSSTMRYHSSWTFLNFDLVYPFLYSAQDFVVHWFHVPNVCWLQVWWDYGMKSGVTAFRGLIVNPMNFTMRKKWCCSRPFFQWFSNI